jgi:hypothetical protein
VADTSTLGRWRAAVAQWEGDPTYENLHELRDATRTASAEVEYRGIDATALIALDREIGKALRTRQYSDLLTMDAAEVLVDRVVLRQTNAAYEREVQEWLARRKAKPAKKEALPKLLRKHRQVLEVLREFGDYGTLSGEIHVAGITGKTMQRHLALLRRHKLVEIVKGTRRWRVIGQ